GPPFYVTVRVTGGLLKGGISTNRHHGLGTGFSGTPVLLTLCGWSGRKESWCLLSVVLGTLLGPETTMVVS
ncbi:hypothetical protein ACHABQ_14080, partial [Nesterenkonia aurantiaca]|uniref:hypothetical protein n=1 Tax=Nesterenkonia aurantiaca TaxID=1436010 RepID=UPI003EE59A3A